MDYYRTITLTGCEASTSQNEQGEQVVELRIPTLETPPRVTRAIKQIAETLELEYFEQDRITEQIDGMLLDRWFRKARRNY